LKENFDRFNFEIYKEKEMADFRRWFTVLAVMALFVGLASAQVGTAGSNSGSPFTCAVQNVTVTPNLRSEGFTEQTGDIVLVCTGGAPLAAGTPIPTVNITVYYGQAVTSRLLGTITSTAAVGTNGNLANTSEALLLIDEPNGGNLNSQQGYGPLLNQMLCNNPANGAGPNGCPQWVGTAVVGGASFPGVPVTSLGGGTAAQNMFAGVVGGSSVTFNGIPVLPPATAGYSRVYRITNVRINANGFGVATNFQQINASISISGATSLPISNPNPIVGYVNASLKGSLVGAASFNQCQPTSGSFGGLLQFTELFGTAFKTRIDGLKGLLSTNTQNPAGLDQNVTGSAYNSESNFVANGTNQGGIGSMGSVGNGTYTAGLADYGTRLKATFLNVPAGATVFVTTTNVQSTNNGAAVNVVPNPGTPTTATSYAQLIMAGSETTTDGSGVTPGVSWFTNTFMSASSGTNPAQTIPTYAMTSQGNPMVAVWEVLNTQPTYTETISFGMYVAYSSAVTSAGSFPPQGNSQVTFAYAANTAAGTFSATNGAQASGSMPIPRFNDTSLTNVGNFFTVNLCQTVLLFPYVTTLSGWETGISIANTTTDPFGTTPQQGTCTLYWYNTGGANPPTPTTAVVPSGNIVVFGSSSYTGTGFMGYMIARCYFQLAHGAAVVTDIGAQRIVSVYLALVVQTGSGNRNGYSSAVSSVSGPENLGN
jgi:hypothetical protein